MLGDDVFDIIKGIGRLIGRNKKVTATADPKEPANVIASAFQYGIYGVAIWDPDFNLIIANRQYADLHKIPSSLLAPGSSLLQIMHNLKARAVLSPETDPDQIMSVIEKSLADTGQITSYFRLSDDTVLSISAERMPNGNTASFMRNATRDKLLLKKLRSHAAKTEAYAEAISNFPSKAENVSDRVLNSQLDQITKTVATLLETDWCVVWARSEALNTATSASAYQAASNNHVEIDGMVLPDLAGYLAILETSQIIAIDDLDKHAYGKQQGNRAPLDEYAYASIDVPFRQNGRIVGVLSCLDTHQARNWSAADKMFVLSAASHVGNLMSNREESVLWDLPPREIDTNRQAAE